MTFRHIVTDEVWRRNAEGQAPTYLGTVVLELGYSPFNYDKMPPAIYGNRITAYFDFKRVGVDLWKLVEN